MRLLHDRKSVGTNLGTIISFRTINFRGDGRVVGKPDSVNVVVTNSP